jgi:GNAT superfamily N-acetyltransferase
MNITKAEQGDLVEVLFLMKECVEDLNHNGFKHWNNAYPGSDTLIKAIEEGTLYVYRDNGIAKGMIILSVDEPKDYKKVEWKTNNNKVLYLKYLTVHPLWQNKGIAKSLMEYAELYAKDNSFEAMRVDIYSGLQAAEKISELGFNQAGQFHTDFQTSPYFAYEKGL